MSHGQMRRNPAKYGMPVNLTSDAAFDAAAERRPVLFTLTELATHGLVIAFCPLCPLCKPVTRCPACVLYTLALISSNGARGPSACCMGCYAFACVYLYCP